MMGKMKRVLVDLFEETGVYLFTLLGIMLAQYAPLLLQRGRIDTTFEWVRLAISAAMALYIVAKDEGEGDKEGRHKNLKRRLSNAASQGYLWSGLVGLAGQAAGA